jgi:hypothetical protein
MKKLFLYCMISALIPLFLNCSKVLKTETKTYDKTFHYPLDSQIGLAIGVVDLTKAEFLSRLNLPDNARITRVEIQSLSFNVKVNPNNRAPKVISTGEFVEVIDSEHEYEHVMFDKKEISLSSTTGVWVGWVPLNTLVGEGIGMLKAKLANWLVDYQSYTGESIKIMAFLNSPDKLRLALDFDLKITASIQFEYCATTSKLLGSEGLECEDKIMQ